ncbi:MAG: transglutaminase domain-containing protein, partial [Bacteroidota bacterium]|nr:transglutaminase domain-containing protein [Bacteroidota bacterium]
MRLGLFLLFLFVQQVASSNQIKFGKVSKEEVASVQHENFPEANAAILYKNEWVRYEYQYQIGWSVIREVHYRIKIYNKEGFDWATLQVPLYAASGNKEEISGVKGFTFNMENGKVVSQKLRNDGVFEEEVNKYRNKASITMPEVKEGSVLDIEYKIISPLYWHIDEFKLQYDIPVDQAQVRLEIPEYFIFKQYSKGFHNIDFSQTRENRSINVSYRSSDEMGRLGSTSRKNGTLEFFENIYNIEASNLPPLLDEKYTSNIDNFRVAVNFELASTRFPNQPFKNYSLTWEDVAKSIYEYDDFGGELNKQNYFDDDIDQLISGLTSNEEKAMAIFHYVKSKMNWDGYTGVGCSDQGVRRAYKEGTGNVAEINLMLTSMFKYAGLNANPILVSTRSHGIPLFPTSDGFNYVVAGLQIQNDLVLFDATEKNAFPDVLPMRALNWFGRLIREDGSSSQVNLMPKTKSLDAIMMSVELNEDGSINGRYRQQYTANNAFVFRNNYDKGSEDSFLDALEKRHGDLEISEYEVINAEDPAKPVVQSFNYSKEAAFEEVAGKLYLSPLFHLTTRENPFKTEKRAFPVDY